MGIELFKELVRHADVVAENFSVGTMERLGLGYETLKQVKPRLIYASVTAFGQNGPYAHCGATISWRRPLAGT